MIIGLIARLIVKHLPALNDEIVHSIPNKMCECRKDFNRVNFKCSNCSIIDTVCWSRFIQTNRFCCDKCNHGKPTIVDTDTNGYE